MELLTRLKSEMTEAGFPKDCIRLLTRPRELGLAQDVIEYAQKKMMDAIVVGRRGVSGIQKFFDTSVSEAILERSQVIPVWMVNKDAGQNSAEKILVAIDGSEDALRAVDHVGFMISENKDVHVTLIHVTNTAHNYCEINLEDDPEFVQIIEKKTGPVWISSTPRPWTNLNRWGCYRIRWMFTRCKVPGVSGMTW